MRIPVPEKVDEPEVLASKFGRKLIVQRYRHPDGRVDEYSMCYADAHPSIVLPVTEDGCIVAQEEFRYAVGRPVLEVSGGNRKPGQTLEEVALAELRQETGYVPGELILLSGEVFQDPATLTFAQALFLAKDCVREGDPTADYGEYIEVKLFSLREWLEMIWAGEIKDQKTIAITMLALPHLGITINHP